MKNKNPLFISMLSFSLFISCGDTETTQSEEQELNQLIEQQTFLCNCLTEPGNSDFMKKNKEACRDAISKEIGVDNWEKINMRDNPEISERFDELAARCVGSDVTDEAMVEAETETETETETHTPISNGLMDKITSDAGYVWEMVDQNADIYMALTFNGSEFRNVAYSMNGSNNPKDFKRVLELSGEWVAQSDRKAIGTISGSGTKVEWTFNDDHTKLMNNKGAEYQKVRID